MLNSCNFVKIMYLSTTLIHFNIFKLQIIWNDRHHFLYLMSKPTISSYADAVRRKQSIFYPKQLQDTYRTNP